jgi:hypothetical protein
MVFVVMKKPVMVVVDVYTDMNAIQRIRNKHPVPFIFCIQKYIRIRFRIDESL